MIESSMAAKMVPFLIVVTAYVVGSVPFRKQGWLTLALEVAKGVVVALVASPVGENLLIGLPGGDALQSFYAPTDLLAWAAGFAVVLGQCYSPWRRFLGGDGLATALGVSVVLAPVSALCGLLAYGVLRLTKGEGRLPGLAGLLVASVAYAVIHPIAAHMWMAGALIYVILARNEGDIDALLQ